MNATILVINPGSTSTKLALYKSETVVSSANVAHSPQELSAYKTIFDQLDMRHRIVSDWLNEIGVSPRELTAVVGRGGSLPPVESGAYEVNEAMIEVLRERPFRRHASNLGAPIAYGIAQPLGIPAYIYDPVSVDEMIPLVRITGIKEIERFGQGHNLNMRAAALKMAQKAQKSYKELNIVVAHLGGGITLSLHSRGRIIDMISDDQGPFAPERAGGLPLFQFLDYLDASGLDSSAMKKVIQGGSGLLSHFGTTDVREIERRIADGNERAALVYEAMALSVAKGIAQLSVVANGEIDYIVLTGGIAQSALFTGHIAKRVKFIAPVELLPGENEMEALALGTLRVLRGEEQAKIWG